MDIKLTAEQQKLSKGLTRLQYNYAIELSNPKNSQRKAYLNAGGTAKSENAQDHGASQLLSNPKVRAFYDSLLAVAQTNAIMTRTEALERLSKSAKATIHDVCNFEHISIGQDSNGDDIMQTVWTMKDSKDIDPTIAACIKSVTFQKNGPKIEMYDSNGSIKQLSDMQGWNAPKKTEITGKDGDALEVKADLKAPEIASALSELMKKL